jgi:hypothetical protein
MALSGRDRRTCIDLTSTCQFHAFVHVHTCINLHAPEELIMSLLATNPASLHALLLLSDSALPLGSFAFSSGLESFLAHRKQPNTQQRTKAFNLFLNHSLSNIASTALPYVLSAYHDATILEDLDNDVDASTPCTVARRASIAQGKALLTIWERALALAVPTDGPPRPRSSRQRHQRFRQSSQNVQTRRLRLAN